MGEAAEAPHHPTPDHLCPLSDAAQKGLGASLSYYCQKRGDHRGPETAMEWNRRVGKAQWRQAKQPIAQTNHFLKHKRSYEKKEAD